MRRGPTAALLALGCVGSLWLAAAPVAHGERARAVEAVPRAAIPVASAHARALGASLAAPPHGNTRRLTVFRGWERVEVDLPWRVEDLAELTIPVDATGAILPGRHPVVLLLHGRHQWCARVGGEVPDPAPSWCGGVPSGIPVSSYTGYRYLAKRLAAEGRIVISISANGINAQDNTGDLGATARALLIDYHLRRLAKANERPTRGYGDLLIGHLDLSRTVLLGHSRGGEGVVRAAQIAADTPDTPYGLAGIIPLAPVSFARMAPPTVPTITILPACDGDVSDQQGQTYVDRGRDLYGGHGAVQSSVWIPGANHNYFNTQWTPGLSVSQTGADDAGEAYTDDTVTSGSCATGLRLTPAQERAVGAAYLSAAVRLQQDDDTAMLPLFDGTGMQLPSVPDVIVRSASRVGPDRDLLVPTPEARVTSSGVAAAVCRGDQLRTPFDEVCGAGVAMPGQDTMWLGSSFVRGPLPGRTALAVTWEADGHALVDLDHPMDLSRVVRLSARVVLDPTSTGTVLLAVRDADGHVGTAPTAGLPVAPVTFGPAPLRLWAQTLWAPPSAFTGVDLSRVVAVGLATTGQGRAWLIDASRRTHRPAYAAHPLPVADLRDGTVTVPGGITQQVPLTVSLSRPLERTAVLRITVQAATDDSIVSGLQQDVHVQAGMRRATVKVPVSMPTAVGPGSAATVGVAIYPVSGVTVGAFRSTLTVVPSGVAIRMVTLPQPNVVASPGEAMQWDFVADRPGRVFIDVALAAAAMDFAELDPMFRARYGLPASGPMDGTFLRMESTQVDATHYRVSLPLSDAARPGSHVTFIVMSIQGAAAPDVGTFSGMVR